MTGIIIPLLNLLWLLNNAFKHKPNHFEYFEYIYTSHNLMPDVYIQPGPTITNNLTPRYYLVCLCIYKIPAKSTFFQNILLLHECYLK